MDRRRGGVEKRRGGVERRRGMEIKICISCMAGMGI